MSRVWAEAAIARVISRTASVRIVELHERVRQTLYYGGAEDRALLRRAQSGTGGKSVDLFPPAMALGAIGMQWRRIPLEFAVAMRPFGGDQIGSKGHHPRGLEVPCVAGQVPSEMRVHSDEVAPGDSPIRARRHPDRMPQRHIARGQF